MVWDKLNTDIRRSRPVRALLNILEWVSWRESWTRSWNRWINHANSSIIGRCQPARPATCRSQQVLTASSHVRGLVSGDRSHTSPVSLSRTALVVEIGQDSKTAIAWQFLVPVLRDATKIGGAASWLGGVSNVLDG
jgi:hypothetical protein